MASGGRRVGVFGVNTQSERPTVYLERGEDMRAMNTKPRRTAGRCVHMSSSFLSATLAMFAGHMA